MGMEKEEEVRKVEEDYGSAWPGHHTPLLMDSPDTSPTSPPPTSPPASSISQMGNSNKVAYVPPAWRSPSLGNRLVAGVRASPSRARSTVSPWSANRREAWTSMGEDVGIHTRDSEGDSSDGSSDSEDEWRELHNYSATPYWPDD